MELYLLLFKKRMKQKADSYYKVLTEQEGITLHDNAYMDLLYRKNTVTVRQGLGRALPFPPSNEYLIFLISMRFSSQFFLASGASISV